MGRDSEGSHGKIRAGKIVSMRTVALIGEPASGKTTVARKVLDRLGAGVEFKSGILRGTSHGANRYVLGVYSGEKFDGTDRLSMAVQPIAEKFAIELSAMKDSRLFFEGDRLCNISFLSHCRSLGELFCVYLFPPQSVIESRHSERSDTQSDKFISGRRTKVNGIFNAFDGVRFKNESQEESDEVAEFIVNKLTGE